MEPSIQNQMWTRWLDNRLPEADQPNFAIALRSDEQRLKQYEEDLIVHRQLAQLASLSNRRDRFVERIMELHSEQFGPTTRHAENLNGHPSAEDTNVEWTAITKVDLPTKEIPNQDDARTAPIELKSRSRPFEKWEKRRKQGRLRHWIVAITVTVASLIALGAFVLFKSNDAAEQPRAEQPSSESNDESSVADQQKEIQADDPELKQPDRSVARDEDFPKREPDQPESTEFPDQFTVPNIWVALVEENEECQWGEGRPVDSKVAAGPLELISGKATLQTNQGAEVTITGPARIDFKSNDLLRVHSGAVEVAQDETDSPIFVESETNKIEAFSHSRFMLDVRAGGNADVKVEEGAIQLQPWHEDANGVKPVIDMSDEGFDRIEFQSDVAMGPGIAVLEHRQGQFQGWVNVNGQLLQSTDRDLTNEMYQRARKRFEEDPEALNREWQNLIRSLNGKEGSQDSARPNMPADIDNFIEQMKKLPGQNSAGDGPERDNSSGADRTLVIDGKEVRFKTQEEFEAAKREMLGTFSDLLDVKNKKK